MKKPVLQYSTHSSALTVHIGRVFKKWLPLAIATTGISFTGYVLIQQNLRLSANDPQIQLAEDTAARLNAQLTVQLPTTGDISQSLAPFLQIYDQTGQPATGSAMLDGHVPVIPAGVLAVAKSRGSDRLTWQPRAGVRIAAVVVATQHGFVVAGRNLREVEQREDQALQLMMAGWLATISTSLASIILLELN